MPESKEKSSSSSPFNITSVIAVVTVLTGILLASKKLSSDRPFSSSEQPSNPREDQTVEARLWEDPFKWKPSEAQATNEEAFTLLHSQIAARTEPGEPAPILLAVMIQGGTYSEDRESRIRSRFAVVSALGESGYAPETAEHIGALYVPWPATADLRKGWLTSESSSSFELTSFTNKNQKPEPLICSDRLPLSFEWYRWRDFQPGAATNHAAHSALVLWLDEDRFGEAPPILMALLFKHLGAVSNSAAEPFHNISLIGPRSSSTLQAMLPPYPRPKHDASISQVVSNAARAILQNVHLFCATPSAMDETLVGTNDYQHPRRAVGQALTNSWFGSFQSLCPTDAQLAWEVFDELQLRNIDLRRTNQMNLVLISEWDTFYGRMLSLTYAAELACRQGRFSNRVDFVHAYRAATNGVWPANLHSFVYLRGLDGQTAEPPKGERPGSKAESPRARPASLEELKVWTPDENNSVGEAQFDYLARLGERIRDCERHVCEHGGGGLNVIGIVGSDVYDTLLLLQALRPRFPEAVFFTTDLDARFWNPRERDWARNLIVISGYGLQLHPNLQRRVAPFRDSVQTAQYAAALAALGMPGLREVAEIPPRRFEVGRGGAYDLSVTRGDPLHPAPRAFQPFVLSLPAKIALLLLAVSGGILLTAFWRPLRRLTWDAINNEMEALWFREEDVGGVLGVSCLVTKLQKRQDRFSQWLWEAFRQWKPNYSDSQPQLPDEYRKHRQARDFLDFLNRVVLQEQIPEKALAGFRELSKTILVRYLQLERETTTQSSFLAQNSLRRLQLNREILDEFLRWSPQNDAPVAQRSGTTAPAVPHRK